MNTELKNLLTEIDRELFENYDSYDKNAERLFGELSYMVRNATEEIEAHAEKVLADPFSAFEWASGAVNAAAQIKVASSLLYFVSRQREDSDNLSDVINAATPELVGIIRMETLRAARYTNNSTSATHNAVNNELISVWAELAEKLDVYGLRA